MGLTPNLLINTRVNTQRVQFCSAALSLRDNLYCKFCGANAGWSHSDEGAQYELFMSVCWQEHIYKYIYVFIYALGDFWQKK